VKSKSHNGRRRDSIEKKKMQKQIKTREREREKVASAGREKVDGEEDR